MANPKDDIGATYGSIREQTQPASPFDRLAEAVSGLRKMQEMSRVIADRLTGNSAPAGSALAGIKEIAGGGLIDGLDRQTNSIREITDDIYASLSRIENRL